MDPTCDHSWNATSRLRLLIEVDDAWMGSVFPTPPDVVPIDYCRQCGLIRLNAAILQALRAAELAASEAAQ
jgi:hypothetical protein